MELIPYDGHRAFEGESAHHKGGKDRIHLGEFNRDNFYDWMRGTFKVEIYAGIPPADIRSKYQRAYEWFKKAQGMPGKIEPEPTPPNELSDVTDDQLELLEADLAILLRFNMSVGSRLIELFAEETLKPPR